MKRFFLIIFFSLCTFLYSESVEYFGVEVPIKYHDYFVELCTTYKVPIIYAARLIQWESRWNEKCSTTNTNGTKDYGLAKLNSAYISDFEFRYNDGKKIDPFYWKDNLRIGIIHLATLRKVTGSWYSAICSYNMGLTGYKNWREGKRNLPEATLKELEFVFG